MQSKEETNEKGEKADGCEDEGRIGKRNRIKTDVSEFNDTVVAGKAVQETYHLLSI
uniref:Uncharacterized protein n=1 Tax=Octopus bimaculoides TaxID=37653 RepID=A0A0L8HQR4_OCTBM